jgi:hypothetical protein
MLVLLAAGSISAFGQHDIHGDFPPTMSMQLYTAQKPLSNSDVRSRAFHLLEQETGKNQEDLRALYASSGARYFQEFASAMLVSKNLGLDYQQVLLGMKKKSLHQTLQGLGVSRDVAKAEIRKAKREVKTADKGGRLA